MTTGNPFQEVADKLRAAIKLREARERPGKAKQKPSGHLSNSSTDPVAR
jgi:hypothetical protein